MFGFWWNRSPREISFIHIQWRQWRQAAAHNKNTCNCIFINGAINCPIENGSQQGNSILFLSFSVRIICLFGSCVKYFWLGISYVLSWLCARARVRLPVRPLIWIEFYMRAIKARKKKQATHIPYIHPLTHSHGSFSLFLSPSNEPTILDVKWRRSNEKKKTTASCIRV